MRGLTAEQMKRLPRATVKQIGTYRQKIVQETNGKIKEGKGTDANNRDLALENNGIRYISLVSGNLCLFQSPIKTQLEMVPYRTSLVLLH